MDIVDAVLIAPFHHFGPAVVRITTDGDAGIGPVLADARDQTTEKATYLHTRWRLARAQNHHHRAARCSIVDVDGQETAFTVVRVPLRQLLIAVDHVDRVVNVQCDRLRWPLVAPAPDVD